MSQKDLINKSTKDFLRFITIKNFVIPIILSKNVEDQIKYLCNQINKEEWSGILLYSMEGTIKDPQNLKITLEDIFPMNKGNGTYTEYEFNEVFVGYLMEDRDRRAAWRVGHIHSHNSMNTFFSGTDTDELKDNSEFHNLYLSVITNNAFDFTSRIAFRAKVKSRVETVDEDGETYIIENLASEKIVYSYDCEVYTSEPMLQITSTFRERVAEIIKIKALAPVIVNNVATAGYRVWDNDERFYPSNSIRQESKDKGVVANLFDDFRKEGLIEETEDPDTISYDEQINDFIIKWLTLTGTLTKEVAVITPIFQFIKRKIRKGKFSLDEYILKLIETYNDVYFSMFSKEGVTEEIFIEDMDQVISYLLDYVDEFLFVPDIVEALENYQFRIKEQTIAAKSGVIDNDEEV